MLTRIAIGSLVAPEFLEIERVSGMLRCVDTVRTGPYTRGRFTGYLAMREALRPWA